jgi:hypothetical protein
MEYLIPSLRDGLAGFHGNAITVINTASTFSPILAEFKAPPVLQTG